MTQRLKDTIKQVADEMIAMSNEDFMAMIDAHKDGDIARLLHDANFELPLSSNGVANNVINQTKSD
jgi:hypothetical protein